MRIVLVITSSIDYTVDYLIIKYGQKVCFRRLNVDMLDKYQIEITNNEWRISTSTWSVSNKNIYSIYYRKPILPNLNIYERQYQQMIGKDIIATLTGLIDSFTGLVLSKPCILRKSENKIFQLRANQSVGFKMPNTLITNDTEKAINFTKNRDIIIKPITTGKIQHNNKFEIFQTNLIEDINYDISLTPIYLQEYIYKSYEVRLTIINGIFYSVKIESTNKIDWRDAKAKNKYTSIEIPTKIKNKCIQMLNQFHLSFGAFDFIVNENNEWVFLEVNPNGQWLWLEQELNLNISCEIINLLVGA